MSKNIVIPTNPKDLDRLKRLTQEACDCLTRIAAEKDAIKDIVALCKEDFELPPKFINKVIRTKFKADFDKVSTEHEDFEELFNAIPK